LPVEQACEARVDNKKGNNNNNKPVPSAQDITGFRQCLRKGASALFNATTGLPLQSSPVGANSFCSGRLLALISPPSVNVVNIGGN